MFVRCAPCQFGKHEGHTEIIQHPPKDGVGGASCPCDGNCAEGAEERIARLFCSVFDNDALEKELLS